jgi:ATP/maltotriose-dependent transcriptional regulator MalT
MRFDLGRWDELVQSAERIREFSGTHGQGQPDCIASTYLALVQVRRGATAEASAVMDDALPHAREIEDPQVLGPALVVCALIDEARGDLPSARSRIEEWDAVTHDRPYFRSQNLADAVRIACAAGDVRLAERLLGGVVTAAARDRLSDLSARAAIAEANGDAAAALSAFGAAADGWKDFGCALEHGLALLGGARCQLALDRGDESAARLEQAREIFTQLGARPLLGDTDELLGTQPRATAS